MDSHNSAFIKFQYELELGKVTSGWGCTLGKRVSGNLSRVQIPHPPLVSLASADSLISESLIPEEPLPYLHVTSWDILRSESSLKSYSALGAAHVPLPIMAKSGE